MIIMGHYLTVAKWRPNFCPTKSKIFSTLVCVRFLGLPIELFDEEVFMILGNSVSRAIKVDATTVSVRRDGSQESVSSLTFPYPSSLRLWYLENGERWNTRDFTSFISTVRGYGNRAQLYPKSKPTKFQQTDPP